MKKNMRPMWSSSYRVPPTYLKCAKFSWNSFRQRQFLLNSFPALPTWKKKFPGVGIRRQTGLMLRFKKTICSHLSSFNFFLSFPEALGCYRSYGGTRHDTISEDYIRLRHGSGPQSQPVGVKPSVKQTKKRRTYRVYVRVCWVIDAALPPPSNYI